jgi:hypothetical protein
VTRGEIHLDPHASHVGIVGVLSEVQDGSGLWPTSGKLCPRPTGTTVTHRELLAIEKTLEHFDKYLYGQEFHLCTDHPALTWLLNFRNL